MNYLDQYPTFVPAVANGSEYDAVMIRTLVKLMAANWSPTVRMPDGGYVVAKLDHKGLSYAREAKDGWDYSAAFELPARSQGLVALARHRASLRATITRGGYGPDLHLEVRLEGIDGREYVAHVEPDGGDCGHPAPLVATEYFETIDVAEAREAEERRAQAELLASTGIFDF